MPEQKLYADARTVIEAARRMARDSAAMMRNTYESMTPSARPLGIATALQQRGELVSDSYLTGAEEMLKMLMGDFTPELWSDNCDHEARLTELLAKHHASGLEGRVAEWVRTRIGVSHMHRRERAMRLLEESVELAQAEGVTIEMVFKQTAHVFSRPAGEPTQEAAGIAVCLLGWCAAAGKTLRRLATTEIERIEAKPLDQIRGSLARKTDTDLVTCVNEEEPNARLKDHR